MEFSLIPISQYVYDYALKFIGSQGICDTYVNNQHAMPRPIAFGP